MVARLHQVRALGGEAATADALAAVVESRKVA